MPLLIASTLMITIAAAARSTWSPCGLSMLASITPLSQRGRGHGYRYTATWFVVGGILGGATLGAGMAALSLGTRSLSLTPTEVAAILLALSVVAVASDVGLGGFELPVHHRQVNERWLDQYRAWVYGAGFGWQIGTGLATYIMTASVYLMIALCVLVGHPWFAFACGALFGSVRGCAVLLGRGIVSTGTLGAFHRRFQQQGPVVRWVTVGVQATAVVLVAWAVSPWAAGGSALIVWPLVGLRARRELAGRGIALPAEPPLATVTLP
jgi:hypothetical protein